MSTIWQLSWDLQLKLIGITNILWVATRCYSSKEIKLVLQTVILCNLEFNHTRFVYCAFYIVGESQRELWHFRVQVPHIFNKTAILVVQLWCLRPCDRDTRRRDPPWWPGPRQTASAVEIWTCNLVSALNAVRLAILGAWNYPNPPNYTQGVHAWRVT